MVMKETALRGGPEQTVLLPNRLYRLIEVLIIQSCFQHKQEAYAKLLSWHVSPTPPGVHYWPNV